MHVTTRYGAERGIRYAFDLTRKRNEGQQAARSCAKTNVLTFAHDTWWRAFNEVGEADYPDIKRDYAHVDATCMWMVKNPEWFDVIVTENMFGDIITDLGAMIQGGMGIAAGGNINPAGRLDVRADRRHRAEVHRPERHQPASRRSAPAQMMLEHLGETATAQRIEGAVDAGAGRGKIKSLSAGKMGMGTAEVGDLIAKLATE